jgi:hypothetical protein
MTGKPNSEQTIRAQLNEIADHWATHDEYPEDISETDVQELSQILHDQLEDRIETYVDETIFSRREAEVWALRKHIDEHHHFVTQEAAALLLSTSSTGFGDTTGTDEETSTGQAITSEDVEQLFEAANKKIDNAERSVGAVTFPDRYDVLNSPELVWLDGHTVQRLRNQHRPGENTLNEVVARVLDETETWHSIEAFVHHYLNARGKDNVAQVAIERQSFKTGALQITAHTSVQGDLPDIVTETDAITHHGHRYDLHFHEDPAGPQDLGRITLYASDGIAGMDAVRLENGLAAADEHMQELLESNESLPSRTVR